MPVVAELEAIVVSVPAEGNAFTETETEAGHQEDSHPPGAQRCLRRRPAISRVAVVSSVETVEKSR